MPATALPQYTIEWGHAPLVEQTTWLGEGDFCTCYLVNDTHVFRFAKHAQASAAMRVEGCLLPILRNHLPVAVPHIEFTGHSPDTGQALMGYQLLPGEPLERDVLDSLPAASQAVLIAQIADVARQLHALPLQRISHCNLPVRDPLTHLTDIIDRARVAIWSHLAKPVQQYYENLLERYTHDPTLHTYQPTLLHGDLSPDHFLADTQQARLTGVIDWGDAYIGDPAWDWVYIYEDYGPDILQACLDRYDPRNTHLLARKVQIYQQLNNVPYCLSMQEAGDERELREVLALLEAQASAADE